MCLWTGSWLVQIMACHVFGTKSLPEPILASNTLAWFCALMVCQSFISSNSIEFESELALSFFQWRRRLTNAEYECGIISTDADGLVPRVINPLTPGNAWVRSQHCGYWCPGAKAPGHQYPQCWLNIHCIWPDSYENIVLLVNTI